jgi:hypothetical protein
MSEEELKRLLSEWITEEFVVTDIGNIENKTTTNGEVVRPRDYCLGRYRSWLARLRKSEPSLPTMEQKISEAIRTLEALSPQDDLTLWEARSQTTRYHGLCSRLGMITFYDPEPIKAEPGAPSSHDPAEPLDGPSAGSGPTSMS